MRETVLLLDQPAAGAIADAAEFLSRQGLQITHQTAYSVAFATPSGGGPARQETPELGAGQIAAVPVQIRPKWCRVWVTVNGSGAVARAAEAYVAAHQERSAAVTTAVRDLERGIYDEARWPAYEATLRATLQGQGLDPAALEARLVAFKKRWLALGRKAAGSPEAG